MAKKFFYLSARPCSGVIRSLPSTRAAISFGQLKLYHYLSPDETCYDVQLIAYRLRAKAVWNDLRDPLLKFRRATSFTCGCILEDPTLYIVKVSWTRSIDKRPLGGSTYRCRQCHRDFVKNQGEVQDKEVLLAMFI